VNKTLEPKSIALNVKIQPLNRVHIYTVADKYAYAFYLLVLDCIQLIYSMHCVTGLYFICKFHPDMCASVFPTNPRIVRQKNLIEIRISFSTV